MAWALAVLWAQMWGRRCYAVGGVVAVALAVLWRGLQCGGGGAMAWLWRWLWRLSRMKRGAYSALVSHVELHRADDGQIKVQPRLMRFTVSELISDQQLFTD